eukprot:TRINITY_DN29910_c0_g1_i2.p1 TRINITY_DN29910_c0_g1~~TRINITY_DN29910_c0_g1_i2.p1  ORF type:complete len:156 (-),score=23.03 TRINITY_DN29910_c0_g1_i2:49-516(-)
MYFGKSVIGVAIFLSAAGSTLKCWDCTAVCETKNEQGQCVSDSGCMWTEEEQIPCASGVNHCMKLDYNNGTVTRSCAYFSLAPQQLNQDVLLGSLEGTCFKGYDSPLVKKIKDCSSDGKCKEGWQCPCEGDFCNGGVKTIGGLVLIVVLFSIVVL